MNEERVAENFNPDKLNGAQEKSWQVLHALAAEIKPGMSEAEALEIYKILQDQSGAEKFWHPPKIRFGKNTLCAFREASDPSVLLAENDIFFLDVGLVFEGYEGDVGSTFILGEYSPGQKVAQTCLEINRAVRSAYLEAPSSGVELYSYASRLASDAGYELVADGARGHRIGDFPHAVYYRGYLNQFARKPAPNRWILEVQVRDHKNQVGAFFEDIL